MAWVQKVQRELFPAEVKFLADHYDEKVADLSLRCERIQDRQVYDTVGLVGWTGSRCRKCAACQRARFWQTYIRFTNEFMSAERCWWLAPTFAPEHKGNEEKLMKNALQKLRDKVDPSIRYLMVRDTGERSDHVHFHVLLLCSLKVKKEHLDHARDGSVFWFGQSKPRLAKSRRAVRYVTAYACGWDYLKSQPMPGGKERLRLSQGFGDAMGCLERSFPEIYAKVQDHLDGSGPMPEGLSFPAYRKSVSKRVELDVDWSVVAPDRWQRMLEAEAEETKRRIARSRMKTGSKARGLPRSSEFNPPSDAILGRGRGEGACPCPASEKRGGPTFPERKRRRTTVSLRAAGQDVPGLIFWSLREPPPASGSPREQAAGGGGFRAERAASAMRNRVPFEAEGEARIAPPCFEGMLWRSSATIPVKSR